MIEAVKRWVSMITVISIILALVNSITPQNSAGKFAAMCGSLILTFALLSPIIGFRPSTEVFEMPEYKKMISEQVEWALKGNDELEKKIMDDYCNE